MVNLNRTYSVLLHMKKYCNEIEDSLKKHQISFEDFKKDATYKNAISMSIFQIGELVNHLPTEYIEETINNINWNEIRGMRNRFAHGYIDMDIDIIYNVAIIDIPFLSNFIDSELKKMNDAIETDHEAESGHSRQ